jgi:uncharacterized protein YbjT (DUF2867 family)
MSKALLFGISGLIGSSLAPLLSKDYDDVVAPVRKPYGTNNDKLKTPIVDFDRLSGEHRALFEGADVLFYCLGSTRSRAGSFNDFQRIEWQLANQVLGTARAAGVQKVVMISSRGADEMSLFGYLRVKGHIERYAKELGFQKLVIARPSLLMGERSESRFFEGLSISIAKPLVNPLQRIFPKAAPIRDEELARALAKAAQVAKKSLWVAENDELIRLSGGATSLLTLPKI